MLSIDRNKKRDFELLLILEILNSELFFVIMGILLDEPV
jgi:hypothetical protein